MPPPCRPNSWASRSPSFPRGGSPADPGTAVDLDVSDGPFAIEMPDVIGLSEQDAIRTLQEDGFEDIVTVEEFDDEVLEGLVISTDPDHPDREENLAIQAQARRTYLRWGRATVGFAQMVLRRID